MESTPEDTGRIIAVATQTLLTLACCVTLAVWLWGVAEGSVLGFILAYLLILLFVSPIILWGFPVVSLVTGLLAWGLLTLIRALRTRA
jgi:hypothetical protein